MPGTGTPAQGGSSQRRDRRGGRPCPGSATFCASLSPFPCALGLYLLAESAAANKAGAQRAKAAPPKPAAIKPVDVADCYGCHSEIQEFHAKGKHAKVNCAHCHADTEKHAQDPSQKPVTKMAHAVCGGCHVDQYESFISVNLQSKAKVEKATFKSRSPLFDKLIMPHGFSKEHAGAAEPCLHGGGSVRGRPRLRRAVPVQGLDQDPGREGGREGHLGHPDGQGARVERAEDLLAPDRHRGESRLLQLQVAGSHPEVEVHGRPRSEARSGRARPTRWRWLARRTIR